MSNSSATASAGDPVPVKLFDYDRYEARIEEMAARYGASTPFPHVAFDDFLETDAATRVAREFPSHAGEQWVHYRHVNENKASTDRWEDFPPSVAAVVREMNSPRFVALLRKLTGIEGLTADPDIEGGGMHQSFTGGFLNVHTDYTMHRHNPKWRRRCNLILYMNEGWQPEWGGALQIWDSRMRNQVKTVDCLLNRAVIFSTPNALHGFPDPMKCPENQSRKSLQWYYYTVDGADAPASVATRYFARPDDSPMKRLLVRLDNVAVRAYAWAKRKLGISDALVSRVMNRMQGHRRN